MSLLSLFSSMLLSFEPPRFQVRLDVRLDVRLNVRLKPRRIALQIEKAQPLGHAFIYLLYLGYQTGGGCTDKFSGFILCALSWS
jgi:hypothetical protein